MNIIKAVKTGKKFRRPEWSTPGYFWEYVDGNIQDYEGCIIDEIEISDALATDYELYEEGIRPKEAGELWRKGHKYFHTDYSGIADGSGLKLITFHGAIDFDDEYEPIHGQNGWQRLFPPVEDERVDIEDLKLLPHYLETALRIMDENGTSVIKSRKALPNELWEEVRKFIFTSLEISEKNR